MSPISKTKYGTECKQDWNSLVVNECGRYCELCKRTVIDFISWE